MSDGSQPLTGWARKKAEIPRGLDRRFKCRQFSTARPQKCRSVVYLAVLSHEQQLTGVSLTGITGCCFGLRCVHVHDEVGSRRATVSVTRRSPTGGGRARGERGDITSLLVGGAPPRAKTDLGELAAGRPTLIWPAPVLVTQPSGCRGSRCYRKQSRIGPVRRATARWTHRPNRPHASLARHPALGVSVTTRGGPHCPCWATRLAPPGPPPRYGATGESPARDGGVVTLQQCAFPSPLVARVEHYRSRQLTCSAGFASRGGVVPVAVWRVPAIARPAGGWPGPSRHRRLGCRRRGVGALAQHLRSCSSRSV